MALWMSHKFVVLNAVKKILYKKQKFQYRYSSKMFQVLSYSVKVMVDIKKILFIVKLHFISVYEMVYYYFINLSIIIEIADNSLCNILLHCMHLRTHNIQNFDNRFT